MSKRRLTVEAVVFNTAGQVLLVRQGRTRHDWELPGGKVHKTESLLGALIREVHEETGIRILPRRLIGVFFIAEAQVVHDFVFVCQAAVPTPQPTPNPPEIAECGFFAPTHLPPAMRPFTRRCIADALADNVAPPLPVELSPDNWLG